MANDSSSPPKGHLLIVFVGGAIIAAAASIIFIRKKRSWQKDDDPTDLKPKESSSALSANDASSSRRPSPSHGRGYEVFLSFRGADTRKGFTDFLYTSLKEAGVDVFRDNEELHVGEEIGPELLDRIERSKISIPIFSKNYAFSKWCLREFNCMMDCRKKMKQTVLPIFYDVTPDEVQHQKGNYGRAFSKHMKDSKRKPGIDVQKWRKALEDVGTLKGWDLQNDTNGHEGQLVAMIERKVLSDLKKGHLFVTDNLVSVEDKKTAVMKLLEIGKQDVRIVGMYGMGGIGKSTLAKVIFNEIMENFDSCCFLKDIRETSSHDNGVKNLQSRLSADLSRHEYREFSTTDEGISELRRRFREKKVLVVLDDVDENSQLQALLSVDWFAPRSRVIVTTRNKGALTLLTPEELTYEVEKMQPCQSMELFSRHAFRRDSPPVELTDLSKAIVETTGGLPLALEVIGSLLCGKRRVIWEETLVKLKKKPHAKVQEKLKISYDSLEPEQKKIFLDIACLFIGEDVQLVKHMWEDCEFYPENGLEELTLRSLVKVMDENTLWMHDQLRDLGREIVQQEDEKEPGNRSRLWRNREAIHVLKEQKGSASVEAIRLHSTTCFREQNFRNLYSLRFLQIDGADLDGMFPKQFGNLRYLRWRNSPLRYSPTDLDLKNIVILDLSDSKVTHDWKIWSSNQVGSKLKVLILKRCSQLERSPDFSMFSNLEILILDNATRLQVVDQSIGCLRSLVKLSMDFCTTIQELPQLCFLKSLQVLSLEHCSNLQKLDGLDNLELLKELKLSGIIMNLPSLANLRGLRKLNLRCCKLSELEGLEALVSLEELNIRECVSIKKLPDLSNLTALRKMDTSMCVMLRDFDGLDKLVSLEELSIESCHQIEKLPNISNMKALRTMHADGCRKLQGLEGLNEVVSLEVLSIRECTGIAKLPDLSNLKALTVLHVDRCMQLRELEGLDKLAALQELSIDLCSEIETLPSLSSLEALRKMTANYCGKLQEFPNLSKLKALRMLKVIGCGNLQGLDGLDELVSLETLHIRSEKIDRLPNLSSLKMLTALCVGGCKNLQMLRGLEELEALEFLSVEDCPAIKEFPNLSKLKHLKFLHVSGCTELGDLPSLHELQSLVELNIKGCNSLATTWKLDLRKYLFGGYLDGKDLKDLQEHLRRLSLPRDPLME